MERSGKAKRNLHYTRGYKYRVYLSPAQEQFVCQTFKACRSVYNYFLSVRKNAWEKEQRPVDYVQTGRLLTQLKREEAWTWLRKTDSMALQETLRDLDRSFRNFFDRRARYPRFKSAHAAVHSYRTRNQSNSIRWEGNQLRLPRIGCVTVRPRHIVEGRILNATVMQTMTGHFYGSLCMKREIEPLPAKKEKRHLGLILDPQGCFIGSTGFCIPLPESLSEREQRIARLKRDLARGQKGSANYEKRRARIVRQEERIWNTEQDFLQKLTTRLTREYSLIVVETRQGSSRGDSAGLRTTGWQGFLALLRYKAEENGCEILAVPIRKTPGQTCRKCGSPRSGVPSDHRGRWICPVCHAENDGIAAARTLLRRGLGLQAYKRLRCQNSQPNRKPRSGIRWK